MDLPLASFGGRAAFAGRIVTIRCFEDNSLLKAQAGETGDGRIMVVDGGGSTRKALLGDMIGANAVKNGWAGIIIRGAVRDVDELAKLDLGVKALSPIPVKTDKRGLGEINVTLHFGGVTFRPDDWVAADNNGVIRSADALL